MSDVSYHLDHTFLLGFFLQYIPHVVKGGKHVFARYAVIFSVAIVWLYAFFLTIGGAYNGVGTNTQRS